MNAIDRSKSQSHMRNAAQQGTSGPRGHGINWVRFWIQMALAALAFNVIAGLVTWYFIFPHLFPAH